MQPERLRGKRREQGVLGLDADLGKPGVVDQDVQRAVRVLGGGDERTRLARLGEIGDVRVDGGRLRAALSRALRSGRWSR